MTAYVDHVLAVLPFEPELMKKLGGPLTSYVGHPLALELVELPDVDRSEPAIPPKMLVLPGSRKGEVNRLLPIIKDTLSLMQKRGVRFEAVLPAVEHLADYIEEQTANWPVKPKVVVGSEAKKAAFGEADFALACSGTVMLELGFYGIPTVSIYKLDKLGFIVRYLVSTWTACLPNLITDKIVIPELFEEYAHPQMLARLLEEIGQKGPKRDAQLEGFQQMRDIMRKDINSSEKVASIILEMSGRKAIAAS
jgi:lipid-A-disaccharide synthase